MTNLEIFLMIFVCACCTFLTRAIPFMIFRDADHLPLRIRFIAEKLPLAIMLLLILYCLKGTVWIQYPYGLPQIIAVLFVIILHIWKRNMIISIAGGTLVYMLLIQTVFV